MSFPMQPMTSMYGQQLVQPQMMPAAGVMHPVYQQPVMHRPVPAMGPWGMQQPVYVNSMSQVPQGAIPVSQAMLAQALGQSPLGAQMVQPQGPSPVASALKGAGVGALAGAAFGVIPFLPLGLFSGAAVGAAAGAGIGLVRGLRAKRTEGEFHTMQQQEQMARATAMAQMAASTPPGARSVSPAEAQPIAKGVTMSPEMRRTWAAKVAAQKAAAAKS